MAERQIKDLLSERTFPLLSFEFFPPKGDAGMARFREAAERLREAKPDFVTCTWGAGGSTRERTLQICELLRAMGFSPVMPHLTCVGTSRGELTEIVHEIYERGFRNIMALRGDPPRGETKFEPHPEGFAHATGLIALIKELHPDICCGVAGYPETHLESASLEDDIAALKKKVDAGGDFITTQLFFDNRFFDAFVELSRAAGIDAPIIPGLLPAMSFKQVQRFATLCGSSFPPDLALAMREAAQDASRMEDVGIRWAATQIEGLLANGAPAIHFYVLNRSKAAMAPAVKACFEPVRRHV